LGERFMDLEKREELICYYEDKRMPGETDWRSGSSRRIACVKAAKEILKEEN